MNEIMNTKKITGLKNQSLKESLLTIRGAVLSVNASQWEVAQAVHDILVKETFKEDFETEEKFADFIGISRSNCNKMKLFCNNCLTICRRYVIIAKAEKIFSYDIVSCA